MKWIKKKRRDEAEKQPAETEPSLQSAAPKEIVIDNELRLSECDIWRKLEQLYADGGRAVWEFVPFYLTTSAYLARSYAELIISALMDMFVLLNKQEPIYILELGSGTGRLSFYLNKELARKRPFFPHIAQLNLKYVMCDFSANTIASWSENEQLYAFRQSGSLDVASFRPEEETEIDTVGGVRIAADTVKNPVFVIANYFFDSLRHDVFRVKDNQLEEVLNTFYMVGTERDAQEYSFTALKKRESYKPVSGQYYADEDLNALLRNYALQFSEATIPFPVSAFQCIKNLRTLSQDRLILLVTDKGFTQPDYVRGCWEQPFYAHDNIFSYPINFDAIARYLAMAGGFTLATNLPAFFVETQLSVLHRQANPQMMRNTHYNFVENVARKNDINHLYYLQNLLLPRSSCAENDMLQAYISVIATCNYEPLAFFNCAERIASSLSEITADLSHELLKTLSAVEDNFFHVRQQTNVLYQIGKIRYLLEDFEGCARAMNASEKIFGATSHSQYYLGACHEIRKEYAAALPLYRKSLALDPASDTTRVAIHRLEEKLRER